EPGAERARAHRQSRAGGARRRAQSARRPRLRLRQRQIGGGPQRQERRCVDRRVQHRPRHHLPLGHGWARTGRARDEGSRQQMSTALPRVLGPVRLWAIAVGLVISGDYFGWNYGLAKGGPVGMIAATLLMTLMYVTFIFSYTELSTAIPHSGGP